MLLRSSYHHFSDRHIGTKKDKQALLEAIGVDSLDRLIELTIPEAIRTSEKLELPASLFEHEYLEWIQKIANKNKVHQSYLGMGYYDTITPSPILRNILENPGWYTQYTPYQAEISQGRLEALLNFQTVVSDLTGFPIANASLLDEGTAAAEAMAMFYSAANKRIKKEELKKRKYFIDENVFPQTISVIEGRAEPLGIEVVVGDWKTTVIDESFFGVLLQYPDKLGNINDYSDFAKNMKSQGIFITAAADILSLTLLKSPEQWGADAAVGSTQRFGVPMGFGGPHAAYFATTEKFKRNIPGRIIGISKDRNDKVALRMALQTREQHIKRDKATSNICTAQALLAIMAGMYAVYHGPKGLKYMAEQINMKAMFLKMNIEKIGFTVENTHFFDTIAVTCSDDKKSIIKSLCDNYKINFYTEIPGKILISVDEPKVDKDLKLVIDIFAEAVNYDLKEYFYPSDVEIPSWAERNTPYLTNPVFDKYQSETNFMRYVKKLENKDLSLMHSMIPLGSCTMKLNAATQLMPLSYPEFSKIHPFAPKKQTEGYLEMLTTLEKWLCVCTGFYACSLQPNSGAQGEFAGLMTIRAFHKSNGEEHRNVAIIPSSAHGTNPASAIMAGMKVVVVDCDERGNINIDDLKEKVDANAENLAALMITYPSTHGVFEEKIIEICDYIHQNGGKVYMDGANMNAQVGLTSPNTIGADVCHLNLHKTFSIPHGGGGPGLGPICVNESLAPFLPNSHSVKGDSAISSISSAEYGSASIALISFAYIALLGYDGVKSATEYAILNANYIRKKLEDDYTVLYTGKNGFSAHELIIDLRMFKDFVSAEDVAKRLIDYGFHAPTLSFPVAGTLMIEPTESEDKAELDRFCEAMLSIRQEIKEVMNGEVDAKNNVLCNAPHPLYIAIQDEWDFPYTRQKALYPIESLRTDGKFWASIARIDNAYGDRNLICTCPDISEYVEN